MKDFLKEYWLWIVIPIFLVALLVVVALFLTGNEGSTPFQYNVF